MVDLGTAPPETPQAAYERYRKVRFFGSLNGLRFLCIGMVLWHHSPILRSLDEPVKLLGRGFLGVDFFFVLSGFLITTLLLREEARDGTFSLRGFYLRRVLRIIPVYFLIVTCMSAYWVWYKGLDHLAPLVPYYYLFLSNFLLGDIPLLSVTWSLAVEEQYYLMWPLLLLVLPRHWRTPALIALIALCVASAAGLLAPLGLKPVRTDHAVWALPATGYSAILIGSLSALTLHHAAGFRMLYRFCGMRLAPVLAFAALVLVISLTPGRLTGFPNLLVHSTMALCLITLVIREDHLLAGILGKRSISRVGEISYGIYLYHLIALHFASEIATWLSLPPAIEPYVVTPLFVLMSIVIAHISFRTFERFFLNLKPAPKTVSRISTTQDDMAH